MIKKIKIWHIVLALILMIVILRYNYIINLVSLSMDLISILFHNPTQFEALLNFSLIDNYLAVFLLITFPALIIFSKKIRVILSYNISWEIVVSISLVAVFIYAPLITTQHPEYQKDLAVTKLLPPLSTIGYVSLAQDELATNSSIQQIREKIYRVIPQSFNNRIIYFDSCYIASKFVYYQAGFLREIEIGKLLTSSNGSPVVNKKIFLFGSDEYGRDVFTRIIYGARISLVIGVGAVLVSLFLGLTLGFIAAEKEGFYNLILSRITDLFLTIPAIFLVIIVLALFGSNILSIIIVLGFSGWMSLFKVVKSEVLNIKLKEYYISARLIGLKGFDLLKREVLPVIVVPVIVNLVFQFSNVILAESALSFLGLGSGNEFPSWGKMIESGQKYISQAWWLIFIPGFILVITLLSINEIGKKVEQNINTSYR